MSRLMKLGTCLFAIALCGLWFLNNSTEAARPAKPASVNCTMDVLFEFRSQAGVLLSSETYTKTFRLQEGVPFVDDFSTATRFKVMSAELTRVGNALVVNANWFDDVGVFDSIDFSTSVSLANGQKTASTGADLTHYSSPGSAMTDFRLVVTK